MAYLQNSGGGTVGSTTATTTLAGVTAGSTLVAFAFNGTSSVPATLTVADGQGSYTAQDVIISDATNNVAGRAFTLQNANAGSHTATVSTDSGTSCWIILVESSAPTSGAVLGAKGAFQNAPASGADTLTSGSVTFGQSATIIGFSADTASITASDEPTAGTTPNAFTSRGNNTNTAMGAWRLATATASANAAATFGPVTASHQFETFAIVIAEPGGAPADQPPQESWDTFGDDAGWYDESALLEASTPTQSVDLVPLAIQLDETHVTAWWDGYEDPWVDALSTLQEMAQPPPLDTNGPEDAWPADAVDEDLEPWRSHLDYVPVGADAVLLAGLGPDDAWDHTDQAGHEDDYPPLVDDDDDAVGPNGAALDQPPADGYDPQFDDADLDELVVDDFANEEVEALRDVEWTWDDDGLDQWGPESAPVGPDAADQPAHDPWPWDDAADDDYLVGLDDDDDAVGPDAPATAPPEDGWPRLIDEADLDELFIDDYAAVDLLPPDPPSADGYSPQFDEADLDELFVDDCTAVDLPPADLPPADGWPVDIEAADLDELFVDDTTAVDLPELPSLALDDAWPWDDVALDEIAAHVDLEPVSAATLPALAYPDEPVFDTVEDWQEWQPDNEVLSANAPPPDQPPDDGWDWTPEAVALEDHFGCTDDPRQDALPDQPPEDGWDWWSAEDATPEDASWWTDDARPDVAEQGPPDAWPWFADETPEDFEPPPEACGIDFVVLPSNLAGDDAWMWFEEWVADPWPDDVILSSNVIYGYTHDSRQHVGGLKERVLRGGVGEAASRVRGGGVGPGRV